ncbi:MAG TPA: FmdB family transcriptional regulator [Deltaproteobacteria bacterium]|jgi:putative FmdB family regulatory protein|nr:FmdB family transcriptional regulator [Deltaproteobacteria bacterium]
MPTYEYQCEKCGHEFEREQRITDDPIKTCPKCKAPKAKRLISTTSFVLKGGGWYSDLYSSSGAKKEAKDKGEAAAPSTAASDAAATTGADSKAAKKDSKKSTAAA